MILFQQLPREIEELRRRQAVRIVSLLLLDERVAPENCRNDVDVLVVLVGEAEEEDDFEARVLRERMHTPGGPAPPRAEGVNASLEQVNRRQCFECGDNSRGDARE